MAVARPAQGAGQAGLEEERRFSGVLADPFGKERVLPGAAGAAQPNPNLPP